MIGHYWTLRPHVLGRMAAGHAPSARLFSAGVADRRHGTVSVTGLLSVPPGARRCLVVVHGLGGDATSVYAVSAARAAAAAGLACLRLELRGANKSGEDLYSAALTADLEAAIKSPELGSFDELIIIGYSLGGHLVLRFATEPDRSLDRVRGVAAICPPIDLDLGATAFDRTRTLPYRRHILSGLHAMASALARRGRLPLPLHEALSIDRIRAWDERIVAPRFGYASAEAYYAEASVAPHLGSLRVPALLVAAVHDPIVPSETVRAGLARSPGAPIDVRWIEGGGHVGFPATLDLGQATERGLGPQVIAWLTTC